MRKLFLASCTIKNEAYPDGFTEHRLVVVTKEDVLKVKELFPEWGKEGFGELQPDSANPGEWSKKAENDRWAISAAYVKANQGFAKEYRNEGNVFTSMIVKPAFDAEISDTPIAII